MLFCQNVKVKEIAKRGGCSNVPEFVLTHTSPKSVDIRMHNLSNWTYVSSLSRVLSAKTSRLHTTTQRCGNVCTASLLDASISLAKQLGPPFFFLTRD